MIRITRITPTMPARMASLIESLPRDGPMRSEEHTSELQSRLHLVCRLLLEKKKKKKRIQLIISFYINSWALFDIHMLRITLRVSLQVAPHLSHSTGADVPMASVVHIFTQFV